MSDSEIIARALADGWTYDRTLLYDEEGIEGFLWTGPGGKELTSFAAHGDWRNGPEVPDQLRERYAP